MIPKTIHCIYPVTERPRPWLFDPALRDEAKARSAGSQAIHVFESFWRDTVSRVDVDWVEKTDCLFSDIFNSAVI